MKLREGKWLDGRIQEWVREGLISPEQGQALQRHEADQSSTLSKNVFAILFAFGGVCVALGVILLISFNWEAIPKGVRIGGFLLLLAGAAETSVRLFERQVASTAAVGLIWLMLPLAGIGLYGQVYQLSGDAFKPLLVWLILSVAPVWMIRKPALSFTHTAGIVAALFTGILDHGSMITLSQERSFWWHEGWQGGWQAFLSGWGPSLLGILLMWVWAFWQAVRLLGPGTRRALGLALLAFLGTLAYGGTVFCAGELTVWVIPGALSAMWWGLQTRLVPKENQGLGWGVLLTAATLYGLTFSGHELGLWRYQESWPSNVYTALLTLAAILGVLDLPAPMTDGSRVVQRVLKGLVLLPLFLGILHVLGLPRHATEIAANVGLLGFAFFLGWLGVRTLRPRLINWATALTGLLIVTRFIDIFGGLLQSGVAFICTGMLFIGLAWAFNVGRKRLLEHAMGGAQ